MRCPSVRKQLQAYLDGELPPQAKAALDHHLQSCSACQQIVLRGRQLASLVTETFAPPIPESFPERLLARASRQMAEARPTATPLGNRSSRRLVASVAMRVAAAVVLVVGLGVGMLLGGQTGRRAAGRTFVRSTAAQDPVSLYNLDYLSGVPEGSFTQAYLSLVSARRGSGD